MPPLIPQIQHPVFKLNNEENDIYLIKRAKSNGTRKNISNFEDSVNINDGFELCGIEDGVYTWIICYDERSAAGDVPLLYLTRTQNIHEIGTKHINIVNAKCLNGNVNYAGELIKEGNTIRINLLSGTYMMGKVKASNIPIDVQNEVHSIFQDIIRSECPNDIEEIIIENTSDTYIEKDMKMTIGDLIEKHRYGFEIYKFTNQEKANKYRHADTELIKLETRLPIYERQKNESLIKKTKNSIDEYKQLLETKPLTTMELEGMQKNQIYNSLRRTNKSRRKRSASKSRSKSKSKSKNKSPEGSSKKRSRQSTKKRKGGSKIL